MAYIGKEPQVGNYVKLDAITTSSTNTYNLLKDSVAFTPESALHMLVSLNGVIQSPLSSFSVSGSTITFLPSSGTLSSSDTIDFILVLGNVLDIGTPSDSTVTNAKTNFASSSSAAGLQIKGDGTSSGTSGTLQLNCSLNTHGIKLASPAHTHGQNYTLTFPTTAPSANKALITDGSGNLSFGDAGGGTVLQTLQYYFASSNATSSTSYTGTDCQLSITPSATTSKVLIFARFDVGYPSTNNATTFTLFRDSTDLDVGSGRDGFTAIGTSGGLGNDATYQLQQRMITWLDAPSSTSALNYRVYFKVDGGTGYFNMNQNGDAASKPTGCIILQEIGA